MAVKFTRLENGDYEGNGWTISRIIFKGLHGPRETYWDVKPTQLAKEYPQMPRFKMPGGDQRTLADAKKVASHQPAPTEPTQDMLDHLTAPPMFTLDEEIQMSIEALEGSLRQATNQMRSLKELLAKKHAPDTIKD